MEYNVIFTGKILADFSQNQVRANVGRRLRIDNAATLDRMFSGKPCIIKKGIPQAKAEKYLRELLREGAICEMRPVGATATASETAADAAEAAEPVTSPTDAAPAPAPAPMKNADAFDRTFSGLKGLNMGSFDEAMLRTSVFLQTQIKRAQEAKQKPVEKKVVLQLEPVADAPPPERRAEPGNPGPAPAASRHYSSYTPEPAQEDVRGLCWGGFFAPWLWATFNGYRFAAGVLVVLYLLRDIVPHWGYLYLALNLPAGLFLLFKGRALAWNRQRWASLQRFNAVQARWLLGGLVFFLIMTASLAGSLFVNSRLGPYKAWEDIALSRETALLLRQEAEDIRERQH